MGLYSSVYIGDIAVDMFSLKEKYMLESVISTIKILLEQRDPIFASADALAVSRRMKPMTGLFLLAAIILSNAYKNTNVYNMVVSRKPLVYKYFDEVVQDKFNICTRATDILFLQPKSNTNSGTSLIDVPVSSIFARIQNYSFILMSEVRSLELAYASTLPLEEMMRGKRLPDKTLVETGVSGNVTIHPLVNSSFKN